MSGRVSSVFWVCMCVCFSSCAQLFFFLFRTTHGLLWRLDLEGLLHFSSLTKKAQAPLYLTTNTNTGTTNCKLPPTRVKRGHTDPDTRTAARPVVPACDFHYIILCCAGRPDDGRVVVVWWARVRARRLSSFVCAVLVACRGVCVAGNPPDGAVCSPCWGELLGVLGVLGCGVVVVTVLQGDCGVWLCRAWLVAPT